MDPGGLWQDPKGSRLGPDGVARSKGIWLAPVVGGWVQEGRGYIKMVEARSRRRG